MQLVFWCWHPAACPPNTCHGFHQNHCCVVLFSPLKLVENMSSSKHKRTESCRHQHTLNIWGAASFLHVTLHEGLAEIFKALDLFLIFVTLCRKLPCISFFHFKVVHNDELEWRILWTFNFWTIKNLKKEAAVLEAAVLGSIPVLRPFASYLPLLSPTYFLSIYCSITAKTQHLAKYFLGGAVEFVVQIS